MKKSEIAQLLAYKCEMEERELTELQVESWMFTVADLDFDAAMLVAREHYRTEPLDDQGRQPRLKPRHLVAALEVPWRGASDVGDVTAARLEREVRAVSQ